MAMHALRLNSSRLTLQRGRVSAPAPVLSARRLSAGSRRARSGLHAAERTPDAYVSIISEAEEKRDWLRCVEAMTEVSVLNLQLPSEAQESAIRTLARGGQASRSGDLLHKLFAASASPSSATILEVMQAWAAEKQAAPTKDLLQVLEERQPTLPAEIELLGRARNLYVRTLAVSGSASHAADLLDEYLRLQGREEKPTLISTETYSVVVHELVKAGDGERANDVLESRDYLQE